jgi:hypothetical protein
VKQLLTRPPDLLELCLKIGETPPLIKSRKRVNRMTTGTMTKKEQKQQEVQEAKEQLLKWFVKEGDTVYTVLRSVSSSGMSRTMSLKVVNEGRISDLTYWASKVLDWPLVEVNGSRALRVGGCGMDMGFHTVYTLARVLFRDKYEGQPDAVDAGYSLSQAWL